MRTFHAKSCFVLFLLFLCSVKLSAGTPYGTFIVVERGNVTDVTPYNTAIAGADLESFRYQDKRCTIVFDNGVKVELLSATEMYAMGLPVVVADYKTDDTPGWIQPIFHLNADGTLSALYTKPDLKQKTTNH